MKISKLKEGQVIKNYKELCRILEVKEPNGGNSKMKLISDVEIFYNIERKGHKYIILNKKDENISAFLTYYLGYRETEEIYTYIKARVEDYEMELGQSVKEICDKYNLKFEMIRHCNQKLIDAGFMELESRIKKYHGKTEGRKTKKIKLDPIRVQGLRLDFNLYITKLFKEPKCKNCGSELKLEVHHSEEAFSVILDKAIKRLNIGYKLSNEEYRILRDVMLGMQIRKEYRTLCKKCHRFEHIYSWQNKYKLNKDNILYKIAKGDVKFVNYFEEGYERIKEKRNR